MRGFSEFLAMGIDDLHEALLSEVLKEISAGRKLVDALSETARYEGDYEFRLVVDGARAIIFFLHGNYDELLKLSKDIIDRAESYEMWRQLALGYNSLGNAYYGFGIFERALECYILAIGVEKRHGINDMTSAAYNNMGLIYANFNADEKAYEYMKMALSAHERGGSSKVHYRDRKVQYMSNIVICLCKSGRIEKVKPYLDQMEELRDGRSDRAYFSYLMASMYYSFFLRDYEKGREEYFKAKEAIQNEGVIRLLILVIGFVSLCELAGLPSEFYIGELIEIEDQEDVPSSIHAHLFYDRLRKYYKSIGNREKFDLITERYISSIRLGIRAKEEEQILSFEIVEDLTKKSIEAEERCVRNMELKRMADEAVANKQALEKAYKKIEIINELGRRITATMDLSQVIELIYNSLKENMPLDIFIIVVPNEKERELRSIVHYSFGKKGKEEVISFDYPGSIFMDAYQNGRMILSWKEEEEHKFKGQHEEEDRPSAIFFPLIVENKTIGVCSIQYGGANAYSDYHLKFLRDATPYLSIALNNALRSMELLETQKKLKELNDNLQKMSAIDGLTQINRRRIFDEKILETLTEANHQKKAVSVLMIDIDNFKAYNDTYGHLEGDLVLKKVAHVFREIMEAYNGLSARFGGEEFIGAFSGYSAEESYYLADRIRGEIENLKILHERSITGFLTVSIGVAISHIVDVSMKSELMRIADESLYKAKNSGKNRVVITEI